jgi:putative lipoic acid-binding regulatory protein
MLEDRARAIALLEATHQFPVEYHLTVITHTGERVFASLREAVEMGLAAPLAAEAYTQVSSAGGKYTSHRFRVPCRTAEDVLALYERVRLVEGVVTLL